MDAVSAIAFAIKNNIFDGEIYNVLTDNLTVRQIVGIIKRHVAELKVDFVDSKIMNQLSYNVAMEKYCKLGFLKKGDIQIGISETIGMLEKCNQH